MSRRPGLAPLPVSPPALRAERERLERELAAAGPGRPLLAAERRLHRVIVRLDELAGGAA